MRFQFPKCLVVDTLTLEQQSRKCLQEAYEVEAALLPGWDGTDAEWHEELMDLYHVAETALRKIEILHGACYLEDLFQRVVMKNRVRGYYRDEGPGRV